MQKEGNKLQISQRMEHFDEGGNGIFGFAVLAIF